MAQTLLCGSRHPSANASSSALTIDSAQFFLGPPLQVPSDRLRMDSAGNNPVQSPNDKSTEDYEKPTNRSSVSSETSIRGIEDENDKVTNAAAYQEKELKVTNGHAVEHDGNNADANEHKGAQLEPIKSNQPSVRDASSIPDGGFVSWLQVLGAFFLFFNSWGVINTFGSYQAYYEEELLSTSTASAISWIGSIQAFLLLVVGAMTGPLYDAGYFRALLVVGTLFLVLGQMMIGLCNAYWQVLLCQAFCIGIGTGMLFIPSVAILSTYFTTRIGTAMGLAASGSSFGGVIYPIVFHKLLPQIGFGWTTRVIGFIILGTMLIPNVCMRVRVLPAKSRSLLDLAAFKLPPYSLQVAGFFIGFMGLYMPFFYAQLYAIQEQITDPDLAFYLLAILNSTSTFGRIIPNFFADKVGPFNVVIPCTVISGILCYCFIAARVSAGLIVLMAFYGFFSGSFVSLPPTIIVHLSLNARDKIGTRLGQSFAVIAIGMLIGTPIGGAILDHHGFNSIWTYGGSMLMGSTVLLIAGRIMHKGWGFTVKA